MIFVRRHEQPKDGPKGEKGPNDNLKNEGPPSDNDVKEELMEDFPEDCVPEDCDPIAVENCKILWEDKMVECEENAEAWAGFCPAPQYTDADGNLRNCKRGCCSEAMDKLHEEMHEEPCSMPCDSCNTCHEEVTPKQWEEIDACHNSAMEKMECTKCYECNWDDEKADCHGVCHRCDDEHMKCDVCNDRCDSCNTCWDEVHSMHEPPPTEEQYEEGPCDGPCGTCDSCWSDEKKQEEAHACYEEKHGSEECTQCHECDWADATHCEAVCMPCWDSEASCDVCHGDCDACNGCWEETHFDEPPMSDDPCFPVCTTCDSCHHEKTEEAFTAEAQCYEDAHNSTACQECNACYETDDWEACEAKCEPCYGEYDTCDTCNGECDACHGCWDDIHGSMEEMPMEEEYVEGPCDGPCGSCDDCWSDPAKQDEASACFQEKEQGEACASCSSCDWTDAVGCEKTCEPCWMELEACDVCKDTCSSCNDCWTEIHPSDAPNTENMPGDMEGHAGHFCDNHDPVEFPCCTKKDRKEQDDCLKDHGIGGGHFCDSHGPEEFPCCAKKDRKEQDDCLASSGSVNTTDTEEGMDDGAGAHTLEMGGEEFHNPCQEPCFECDACHMNESNQEAMHSCFQEKEGSPECLACASCDWDGGAEDCEATCTPCWDSYHSCHVCDEACHACDGCWEETMPKEPADEQHFDDPCVDTCSPCDTCWMDEETQAEAQVCAEDLMKTPDCEACNTCDWEKDGKKCEGTCDVCYSQFDKCNLCADTCGPCESCWNDVHAPDASEEWDTMALAFSKAKHTKVAFETQKQNAGRVHASRKARVLQVLKKGHLKCEQKVTKDLFTAHKRAAKMHSMLKAFEKSKTKSVVEHSAETARALAHRRAGKKQARVAKGLRVLKTAAKHSAPAKALLVKVAKAARKVHKQGKAKTVHEARQNVMLALKKMRQSKQAKNLETRTQVLAFVYKHHKSSTKKSGVPSFVYQVKKGASIVQKSNAIKAIKHKAVEKAKFVRSLYALAKSSSQQAKDLSGKVIRHLTHTKRVAVKKH